MPPFYGVTASADFALSWKLWLHLNGYVCLYIHMVPYGPYSYPYAYIALLLDGTRDVYVHTSSIWSLNACYALTGACFYIDALTRLCTAFHSLYVWVYIYTYIYIYAWHPVVHTYTHNTIISCRKYVCVSVYICFCITWDIYTAYSAG